MGETQGRSERVWNVSPPPPPGFDIRTVASRRTDWAIPVHHAYGKVVTRHVIQRQTSPRNGGKYWNRENRDPKNILNTTATCTVG
jgi:hypothetical protein